MSNYKENQLKNFGSICISILFLCISLPTLAQSTDRFSIYYEQLGKSNNVETSGVALKAGHRLFLDDEGSNLLTIGLNYNHVSVSDQTLASPDKNRELRSISTELNLMKILSDGYSFIAILRPGFYGDLEGDMGNDFRVEGGALITKLFSDNLTMGLGLGRGTSFGRDLVVPLFQFLYFASDKILIRGLLPVRASAWYIPSREWEFGAVFRLSGSLYKVEETNIPGADKLGFASANVGAAVRRNLFANSFAVLEAGITAMRRYEWTDRNGTSIDIGQEPMLDRDLDPVPYVRIGWQHRL